MIYLKLFRQHWKILTFGFLLALFSGLGQSFFISIFVPYFTSELRFSQAEFSSLYAMVTVMSGLLLPFVGSRFNHRSPLVYSIIIVIGLATSCALIASSSHFVFFTLAVFGLRFFGQGLFSHIAATVTASRVEINRGRALSLTSLGFPMSEALLPVLCVYLLEKLGWRLTWVSMGVLPTTSLVFIVVLLLRKSKLKMDSANDIKSGKEFEKKKERLWLELGKSFEFWVFVGAALIPPFFLTALFLHQNLIAETHSWSVAWIAKSFVFFAIGRLLFSLMGGQLVDIFSARKVFSFSLLPLAVAVLLLLLSSNQWIAPTYLFFAGIGAGLSGPVKDALWVETYGVTRLPVIRSTMTSFVVLSTAAGPFLLGWALEFGVSLDTAFKAMLGLILLVTLVLQMMVWKATGRK